MKKNILLIVTGGIAAYKAAQIISLLQKRAFNIKVVMTQNGCRFISPLTLETVSKSRVYTEMWATERRDIEHIELAQWADLIVVAPATYNFVGKIASGIADDLASTVVAARRSPLLIAPAMNTYMYNSPAYRRNEIFLKQEGVSFVKPREGALACGEVGIGCLQDEGVIVEQATLLIGMSDELKGREVLITAGPTEEGIDPVRFISNRSTGKMGYALAEEMAYRGGSVTLITGPVAIEPPANLKEVVSVKSAEEMYQETEARFDSVNYALFCAAVADFRVKNYSEKKIKKSDIEHLTLERNRDILKEMGRKKRNQTVVGFAAESENGIENAKQKLVDKSADLIILNSTAAIGSDNNEITLIEADSITPVPLCSKREAATVIVDHLIKNYNTLSVPYQGE